MLGQIKILKLCNWRSKKKWILLDEQILEVRAGGEDEVGEGA